MAGMTFNFTDFYLYIDNPAALSYYRRTSESPVTYSGTPVTIVHAARELEAGTQTGPGGAMLNRKTVAFHVSQVELGAVVPASGDRLTDANGTRFIVQPGGEYDRDIFAMWRLPVQQEI